MTSLSLTGSKLPSCLPHRLRHKVKLAEVRRSIATWRGAEVSQDRRKGPKPCWLSRERAQMPPSQPPETPTHQQGQSRPVRQLSESQPPTMEGCLLFAATDAGVICSTARGNTSKGSRPRLFVLAHRPDPSLPASSRPGLTLPWGCDLCRPMLVRLPLPQATPQASMCKIPLSLQGCQVTSNTLPWGQN